MKRDMMDIEVEVMGIAKRDRKVKRHRVVIATLPYADIDLDGYMDEAKLKLAEFKSVTRARLMLQPWTDIVMENGVHLKEVTMFDKRSKAMSVEL